MSNKSCLNNFVKFNDDVLFLVMRKYIDLPQFDYKEGMLNAYLKNNNEIDTELLNYAHLESPEKIKTKLILTCLNHEVMAQAVKSNYAFNDLLNFQDYLFFRRKIKIGTNSDNNCYYYFSFMSVFLEINDNEVLIFGSEQQSKSSGKIFINSFWLDEENIGQKISSAINHYLDAMIECAHNIKSMENEVKGYVQEIIRQLKKYDFFREAELEYDIDKVSLPVFVEGGTMVLNFTLCLKLKDHIVNICISDFDPVKIINSYSESEKNQIKDALQEHEKCKLQIRKRI